MAGEAWSGDVYQSYPLTVLDDVAPTPSASYLQGASAGEWRVPPVAYHGGCGTSVTVMARTRSEVAYYGR